MKILRFTLSGRQAFFKKPEVNTYYYFTYGHMHKVALLGMFGAILGYSGYSQQTAQKQVSEYPEFYERLKELKISMIPFCEKGSFSKKIVSFNNSVGYASKEQGGNLIIKQQWLENPQWYIYVMLDCAEAEKIADYIIHKKCVYIPYLGTNDHTADITDAQIILGKKAESPQQIDSFFVKGDIEVDIDDFDQEKPYKYEEALPCGLDSELNLYILKRYVLTNLAVLQVNSDVYAITDFDGKEYHIVFD